MMDSTICIPAWWPDCVGKLIAYLTTNNDKMANSTMAWLNCQSTKSGKLFLPYLHQNIPENHDQE